MKRLILALCLVVPFVAQAGIEQEILIFRGDVNGSGDGENPVATDVNISDVVFLSNWLNLTGPAPDNCPYEVGDFNGDSFVSSADVTDMVAWLFDSCYSCIGSPNTVSCAE